MKRIVFFLAIATLFCITEVRSQNVVTLMNGVELQVDELTLENDGFKATFPSKNGLKTRTFGRTEIFSYTKGSKTEIFYEPALYDGGSLEETKAIVTGYTVARRNFSPVASLLIGGAAGFAAGYGLKSVLAGIPVPPVLMLLSKTIPVSQGRYKHPDYADNADYRWGVRRQAKNSRAASVLISSAVGVAAGLIVAGQE